MVIVQFKHFAVLKMFVEKKRPMYNLSTYAGVPNPILQCLNCAVEKILPMYNLSPFLKVLKLCNGRQFSIAQFQHCKIFLYLFPLLSLFLSIAFLILPLSFSLCRRGRRRAGGALPPQTPPRRRAARRESSPLNGSR